MDDSLEKLNELRKEILDYIKIYKDEIPLGFLAVSERENAGIEDTLESLEILFKVEEKEIEEKRVKMLFADAYEIGVRKFAVAIIRILIPRHLELKQYAVYQRLLVQKHMAYAFFHAMNNQLFLPILEFDYLEFHKGLYLGLVKFYEKFYGKFSDNEEAIELLCKYYPKGLGVESCKHQIADALYMHISNAGTPNDTGYAFQGIAKIESFIGKLPTEIIMELLNRYQVRLIVNNAVYRHQVYAIITHAQTGNIDKNILKFFLLDSVILALQCEPYFTQKMAEQVPAEKFSAGLFEENYITGSINVCKEPNAYWSSEGYRERVFFLDGRPMAKILLNNIGRIEINNMDENRKSEKESLDYSAEDWALDNFFSKETDQKLRKLILGAESQYNEMFFSLLYLDNYRGIQNKIIDLDHKFQYEQSCKILKRRKKNLYPIRSFYGQAVQTLSCIVGKNGMGKTSIVDFLRDFFFKILRLIEDYGMPCEQGYLEETDYREYNILDKGAGFLIVFQLGRTSFYLTNISDVECEGVEPFRKGIYNNVNEFSKVAYFSNVLKNNQEDLFMESSDRRVNNKQIQAKRDVGKSLRGFRQVDYSETESFIRRRKAIALELQRDKILEEKEELKGSVNREFCYQLTFLKNMDARKICEYLDIDEHKKFKISSNMKDWMEETFSLEELKDLDKINQLEKKYLFLPDAQIQYFSSGQYAKFAFLAKLYWFLEGYHKEIKRYRDIIGENEFQSEDVLFNGETALIFIDEGETYYHPEWQRRYVKTLLEMMSYVGKDSKIQIVITTNSPFILSDILKEDVTYLAGETEKYFDRTLGQNVHRLLRENFFMDYTIGEYARALIENIMSCLKNTEKEMANSKNEEIREMILRYYGEEKDVYPAVQLLIEQIGEPVYRYELEALLAESDVMKKHRYREWLLEEKRKIEEKINDLEKKEQA